MSTSETPLTGFTGRIAALLQPARKPLTFKQLMVALNQGLKKAERLDDAKLKTALEAAVNQRALFRWPDYRGAQCFWSQSPDQAAQQAVLAIATEEALSKTELIGRACKKVQGFSRKAMQRIVLDLAASRELQPVAAFTSGKLLMRSGSQAAYAAAARKFIEKKFRNAGFDPAEFLRPPGSADAHPVPAASLDPAARILEVVRSLEPNAGVPVSTQNLRKHLPALGKSEFDAAGLKLRDTEQVFLSLHHDPHNLTQQERDLLIDGGDGKFYVAIAIRR
jgi:hypothetical protein